MASKNQKEFNELLNIWRKNRKEQTGKMITTKTAIETIVLEHLRGIKPAPTLSDRVNELEVRVIELERTAK